MWGFHTSIDCYLVISIPNPNFQLFQEPQHSSPNFIPSFFGKPWVQLLLTIYTWGCGHPLKHGQLPGTTTLKKMYGPSPDTSLNEFSAAIELSSNNFVTLFYLVTIADRLTLDKQKITLTYIFYHLIQLFCFLYCLLRIFKK